MRIAAIDLGTNTILLLVCDVGPSGLITDVLHEERIPRIGRDVDKSGMLTDTAVRNAAAIVTEYRSTAEAFGARTIRACATSAVRDARNGKDFVSRVADLSGVPIRILSGDEEALLTYRGAVKTSHSGNTDAAVIDIGGGSTEIIVPAAHGGEESLRRVSLQVGTVRMTERFFKTVPPQREEHSHASKALRAILETNKLHAPIPRELVGVAGSITTLACLDLRLSTVVKEKVEGYTMNRSTVHAWLERLRWLSPLEVLALSPVAKGREDILLAGLLILNGVMAYYGFERVRTTVRGLRYGFAAACRDELTQAGEV
jgi:exopolyphosphatase/guanosine-5'-triphosphate,3'-diphosphate pyrophosphatase